MTFSSKMNNGIGSTIIFAIRLVFLLPLLHQSGVSKMTGVQANPDAKRLYDDLLSHYNRLIRPVSNNSQVVTVRLGLHLTQLIDLDLKNQILTTNVWVEHEWIDAKLTWDPEEYGGVRELMVPSEHIWLPDIVLYNNADGEYAVTTMTKAILHSDGHVKWNPPAIFKSYCEIDVRYFPFDTQTCFMKFGSWTYSGLQMDLKHLHSPDENLVEIGMNLKDYYPSGEWDILDVPAERHAKKYDCCPEFFADIFFNITLRRKTLFYTVNLIIPCVGISCLSVLVFYLPADSGEKVALCITTLLSQTMFFLLMSEIIPSTSLAMPLLGKYLLFTMCLVGLSVLITIVILNVRYRKPSTHKISPWVRRFFIQKLPKMLLMRIPKQTEDSASSPNTPTVEAAAGISSSLMLQDNNAGRPPTAPVRMTSSSPAIRRWSRSASPFHFGSQLLCEIINYNSVQQQQQDRYYQQQQQQQQQQYPLCASRLPPPPQTPSSPISIITTMPLYPPPPPPLSFLPTQLPPPPPPSLTYPHITSRRSSTSDEDDSSLRSCCQATAPTSSGAFAMATSRDCAARTVMTCPHDDDGSGRNSLQMRRRRQEFHRPTQRIPKRFPLELQKAIRDVQFIQNHMKREDEYDEEDNDWGFIAMVLDRFFLWVFTVASLCGTISILFTAPALYDNSSPINLKYLDRLGFY
ncbi:acetylcholine receptor subunit alpha-L1-like isoform X1 [Daphnia carinata]|uniref:acetylcholine receptor subunit alpha-L1-like isoform X1 n=2 Tax=Daphnia carinata TaxID=120202 RepID=UPI00257F5B73|nr:acetylcholine receptor subunit alpha-L1-like isoform X1 [Daphnia carinata]XP_057378025.1 acetylcholine receptor subunit alpha-L1-like isoform X1 [Daphnia carinata]